MKFPVPFRKAFDRSSGLAELGQQFEAIGKIADPAERLLQYERLQTASTAVYTAVDAKSLLIGAPGQVIGICMLFGGAFSANPLLIGGGIAAVSGGLFAWFGVGADVRDAASNLASRCRQAIDSIINDPPVAGIAVSPHFDKVMQQFPGLKETFTLAASRQKVLDSLPAPKPGNDGQGFKL